jgi:hypothetical protein
VLVAITALFTIFVFAGPASAATIINDSAAPSGTHLQTGSIGCTDNGSSVTCSTYELAGVGNANAVATLAATYSATVTCTNKGGKLVPVKTQTTTSSSSGVLTSEKNGRLAVPALISTAPSTQGLLDQATCPNGNWTKNLGGPVQLASFIYTLDFVGYTGHYLTITG